jgi:hypothetical protein
MSRLSQGSNLFPAPVRHPSLRFKSIICTEDRMTDIVSIVFSAISATQKTSVAVYKLARGCSEARADLAAVTTQLSELTLTLELIKESNDAACQSLPAALQAQLKVIVASCERLMENIRRTVAACNGRAGALRWTLFDKENVKSMSNSLEAFKSGLSLALDTANLFVSPIKFVADPRI